MEPTIIYTSPGTFAYLNHIQEGDVYAVIKRERALGVEVKLYKVGEKDSPMIWSTEQKKYGIYVGNPVDIIYKDQEGQHHSVQINTLIPHDHHVPFQTEDGAGILDMVIRSI